MKKLSLILLCIVASTPLSAQHGNDVERHPFGTFTFGATTLNGSAAIVAGGGAGWQIDRSLALGVSGHGLINRVKGEPGPGSARQIAFGYGGLDVRYVLNGERPYHIALSTLLGGGSVSYAEGTWRDALEVPRNTALPDESDRDFFIIVEPGVDVEANVGDDFRVSLGATYRFISGVSLSGLSNDALSGASARVGFRLGMF